MSGVPATEQIVVEPLKVIDHPSSGERLLMQHSALTNTMLCNSVPSDVRSIEREQLYGEAGGLTRPTLREGLRSVSALTEINPDLLEVLTRRLS